MQENTVNEKHPYRNVVSTRFTNKVLTKSNNYLIKNFTEFDVYIKHNIFE